MTTGPQHYSSRGTKAVQSLETKSLIHYPGVSLDRVHTDDEITGQRNLNNRL